MHELRGSGISLVNDPGGPRLVLEPAFARAEQAYLVELRRQYEAGSLSAERFDAAVRAQTIDYGGRYWMIGVESGEWYASRGDTWEKADPPSARSSPTVAGVVASPPRDAKDVSVAAKPGGADWAIMWAAFLVAAVCFVYLSRGFLR